MDRLLAVSFYIPDLSLLPILHNIWQFRQYTPISKWDIVVVKD